MKKTAKAIAYLILFLLGILSPSTAVAQSGDEEKRVNQLIVQLIQDKDVKKRHLALLDLEIVGPRVKGVLQALSMALEKDAEPLMRREAALTLGRIGEDAKGAIPALAFALRSDNDAGVREAASRALLQMVPYSRAVLQQLIDALQDSYAPTRAAVAEAIKSLGEYASPAVPKLIEYLGKPNDKKADAMARMHVALALGRVGAEGAKGNSVLIAVVADLGEDVAVREAAAESLGRLGLDAQGAAKPLAEILGNKANEHALRVAAAKALPRVEGVTSQVWPALKVALADSDATLRFLTIRAAGPYGKEQPEVVTALAKLARGDDNVEVRLAAIQELGLLGPAAKAADSDLRYIVDNDERETVRLQAQGALLKIQGK